MSITFRGTRQGTQIHPVDACLAPASPQLTQARVAAVARGSPLLAPPPPQVSSEDLAPVHAIGVGGSLTQESKQD